MAKLLNAFAIASMGVVVAACASTDGPAQPSVLARALIVAGPVAAGDDVRTSGFDDLIAAQTFYPSRVVTLDQDFELSAFSTDDLFERDVVRAEAGTPFYLTESEVEGEVYCQLMDESRFRGWSSFDRLCLRDLDENGQFDDAWVMEEVTNRAVIDGAFISPMPTKPSVPLTYTPVEDNTTVPISVGLAMGLRSDRMSFVPAIESIGDRRLVTFRGRVRVPVEGPFPYVITTMGTRIQILGVDVKGETLRYRIMRQPAEGTETTVSRRWG